MGCWPTVGAVLVRSGATPSIHGFAEQRAVGWALAGLAVATVAGVVVAGVRTAAAPAAAATTATAATRAR